MDAVSASDTGSLIGHEGSEVGVDDIPVPVKEPDIEVQEPCGTALRLGLLFEFLDAMDLKTTFS